AELVDEALDVGFGLGVEPLVGHPVAGEELPHGQRRGQVAGADHPEGAGRALQQQGAAGDEGPEDDVGQVGHGGDEAAQLGHRDGQDLTGLDDPGREVDPLAGEEVELAQEAAGAPARRSGCGSIWNNFPMSRLSQLVRSVPLQLGVHLAVAGLLTGACSGAAQSTSGGVVATTTTSKAGSSSTSTTKPAASGDP